MTQYALPFRIHARMAPLMLALCILVVPWFGGARAGGMIGRSVVGVHITFNPSWQHYYPSGSPTQAVYVPMARVPSAYVVVGGRSRHNFTSSSLTVLVYTIDGFGTWNAVGSAAWTAGLTFNAYAYSLPTLLRRLGIDYSKPQFIMIEVDEMDGPNQVPLGATYVRIVPH